MWPSDLVACPTNFIVCTARGAIAALSGGDCDGDTVYATRNQSLIEYLERTEQAVQRLDLSGAKAPADASPSESGPVFVSEREE